MNRWASPIRIVGLLLLGAIVNVAVAWGFAMFGAVVPGTRPTSDLTRVEAVEILRRYSDDAPPDEAFAEGYSRWGTASRSAYVVPASDENSPSRLLGVHESRSGWPARSMSMAICGWSGNLSKWDVVDGLRTPAWCMVASRGRQYLPIGFIWPGFAINTVFYAAILWMLFAAPFALRRRRRIKRGQCPKCAYPVGTNQKCTECGAAVPRKVETSAPQSPNVQSPDS